MKKTVIVVGTLLGLGVLAAGGLLIHKLGFFKPTIRGDLSVLSYAPQGANVPISADGITVMFNKPIVPLTALDEGRGKSVPLKITPDVDGKFFWLGTQGFIFRPEKPLDPATIYHVELPDGLVSLDGYRLQKKIAWNFETVAPRLLTWEPSTSQTLIPKFASVFLRFNIAMDRDDVEKKLAAADEATGQALSTKKKFEWEDDDHAVRVTFTDELPWNSSIVLMLPAGARAKKGTLGLSSPTKVTYTTPEKILSVKEVNFFDFEEGKNTILTPGQETPAPQGAIVCYKFNQPLEKASFQEAFSVSPKKQPYFSFSGIQYRQIVDPARTDGRLKDIEGYSNACISFMDDYDTKYTFSIDPKKIRSLSGVPAEDGGETYNVATSSAKPEIHSLLTKNILSYSGPEGSMAIPYRATNVDSVTVRLYPLSDKKLYNEGLRDLRVTPPQEDDVAKVPSLSDLPLPLDAQTWAIDSTKSPAWTESQIPVSAAKNASQKFTVDLAALPQKPGPGLYLVEILAHPRTDMNAGSLSDEVRISLSTYAIVQVTTAAIAIKHEIDHVLVWVTDIETGKPLANIPTHVTLYEEGHHRQVIAEEATVSTNAEGVGILKIKPGKNLHVCADIIQPGNESYSCEPEHEISGYRALLKPGPHYYAYLYTDRPIYRPGQKVHYSAFVREVKEGRYFSVPAGTPVQVSLTNAEWTKVMDNTSITLEPGGVFGGAYDIPSDEDVPRGDYNLSVTVGEQTFSRTFVVSSYRKPSFKVDVKTKSAEILSREKIDADVQGHYFFGAPMRRAKTTWSIMATTYLFSPEGYEDYAFFDPDLLQAHSDANGDSYSGDYEYDVVSSSAAGEVAYPEDAGQGEDPRGSKSYASSEGFLKNDQGKDVVDQKTVLSEGGLANIRYTPDLAKYPTSQKLSVEANVEDPSHQLVSSSEDVIVHKAGIYFGVKPEKWVYGEKEKAVIDVVTVDTLGKPAPKTSFTVDVVRREYKYIETRTAGGYWELKFEHEDVALKTLSGKTDGQGRGAVEFQIPKGGTYRFLAKGKDKHGNQNQSSTTVFAWGEGYVPWHLDTFEKLELVADKTSYKVGDTAKILVKSLVPVTKALLSYERGRVLDYKVIDLGGNAGHIEIPITEGMIPNFNVSVVAHVGRGSGGTDAHPPLLYFGQASVAVSPESKKLSVTLTPDRTGDKGEPPVYKPGDKVTVKVQTKDPSGRGVKSHVIVSVADESVLRLLDYKLPDLVKKFYYSRLPGVSTSSSLVSFKAGDAGTSDAKKRRIFKDTAHFETHLTTNDQGETEFSFTLPDDLTTWVVEALAASDPLPRAVAETEKKSTPNSQAALDADLNFSDHHFVGSERAKIMTTLPVLIRMAFPRFGVWGDQIEGAVILNNRTNREIKGSVLLQASGDARLKKDLNEENLSFSLSPKSEKSLPVSLNVIAANSGLNLSATVQDDAGTALDAVEMKLPVYDRYAPEVVAASGLVGPDAAEAKEQADFPKRLSTEKGGLDISLKSSIAFAAAPSLRALIDYPWNCSEQRSSSLMALLIARDFTKRFGEKYFDELAPFPPAVLKSISGLAAKQKLIDQKIAGIIEELQKKYLVDYGVRYWPESPSPDRIASAQVLVALSWARAEGFSEVCDSCLTDIRDSYLRPEIQKFAKEMSWDQKAFTAWALTYADAQPSETALIEDVAAHARDLSVSGLSYVLMAMEKSGSSGSVSESHQKVVDRLLSLAKQEPRHTSWPASSFFYSSSQKNTALAALALLKDDAARGSVLNPQIARAAAFLLNGKKTNPNISTQDSLYASWFLSELSKSMNEDRTDFRATVTAADKTLLEKSFSKNDLLEIAQARLSAGELRDLPQPSDVVFKKSGDGTLYYDMTLKYYLPPDQTPTREEGLIVSREYYAIDDAEEKEPLTEFKVGENYRGHLTLVLPQEMNHVLIQDLLPAGFEAVDMTLATSSRAAALQATAAEVPERNYDLDTYLYDDVVTQEEFYADYAFEHREIRDDSLVWSDTYMPAGVYHLRYPVRATTAGEYLQPGATAFAFYEPEIFGRSRTRRIEIEK